MELETSQANVITFNAFLYRLCKGDDKMTAQLIRSLMPGLGETIDGSIQQQHSSTPNTTAVSKSAHGNIKVGYYRVIQPFLDPSNELCKKSLNYKFVHTPVKYKLTTFCLLYAELTYGFETVS